jgi:hypothetical protein
MRAVAAGHGLHCRQAHDLVLLGEGEHVVQAAGGGAGGAQLGQEAARLPAQEAPQRAGEDDGGVAQRLQLRGRQQALAD